MPSLFISAAHKSSGKTTLSIGLCAALRDRQLHVQPFKKGPDYIDPLWLSAASGHACHNLDFNTMSHEEIIHTVQHYGQHADISLIEANKGLYDGISLDGSDNNAAVAKLIGAPVILVIDTRGITRGIAPLLMGYQQFDHGVNIAGVILNRVGGARHAGKLRESVEYYTDLKVLGAVQNNSEMEIEERHLGLMPSNESGESGKQIMRIRDLVAEQVDLEGVLGVAGRQHSVARPPSPTLPPQGEEGSFTSESITQEKLRSSVPPFDSAQGTARHTTQKLSRDEAQLMKVRIGICQDPAFGFYYPGDIEALQQAGAEIIPINTLTDSVLPAIDGLFIGGGFPETQMHQLSANESMRQSIHAAIENGLPTYAECGGLMYLSRSLQWHDEPVDMVGIIPGDASMHKKPQGRGYVKLQETADMPWPGGSTKQIINAHEFHYSALENLTVKGRFAYRMLRGTGIDGEYDGWVYKNLLASYTHIRHTRQFLWAHRFVEFIRTQQGKIHT
ncbi:MAG: Cobyrinic acid A,C-diamide synthase [uncultured Thiotrichaceae bacterium]|uniref:Cobyrinic acid A,C-diamide synthase n=1 Tax=uncultured Thiotrichaceae bacterium TaxID=298394 RepID=A0A6S6SPH8_9GAMM|nr:MAG: Cobyrinic acid A,C-diamide synthase [uncultured Thiotrichaceae bacterium]